MSLITKLGPDSRVYFSGSKILTWLLSHRIICSLLWSCFEHSSSFNFRLVFSPYIVVKSFLNLVKNLLNLKGPFLRLFDGLVMVGYSLTEILRLVYLNIYCKNDHAQCLKRILLSSEGVPKKNFYTILSNFGSEYTLSKLIRRYFAGQNLHNLNYIGTNPDYIALPREMGDQVSSFLSFTFIVSISCWTFIKSLLNFSLPCSKSARAPILVSNSASCLSITACFLFAFSLASLWSSCKFTVKYETFPSFYYNHQVEIEINF